MSAGNTLPTLDQVRTCEDYGQLREWFWADIRATTHEQRAIVRALAEKMAALRPSKKPRSGIALSPPESSSVRPELRPPESGPHSPCAVPPDPPPAPPVPPRPKPTPKPPPPTPEPPPPETGSFFFLNALKSTRP